MSAVDQVVTAFNQAGWTPTRQEKVSGGRAANPTRIDFAQGKQRLFLLVYAWKITGEGKGRGRNNFRIQTTRSHQGDLLSEPNRLTIGFGIDEVREVLVAFDGWTKRATGSSSSVHIERQTLEGALDTGYAEQEPAWDSRAAALLSDVNQLLGWINRQGKVRTAGFEPIDVQITGETAIVSADLWASSPAAWLRPGDRLFLTDKSATKLRDHGIWKVKDLRISVTNLGSYPRRTITFTCRRHGRVVNEQNLLREARRDHSS